MELNGPDGIRDALSLVGELLQARGLQFRIVVIGGAAMNLQDYVARATTDVDILAFADPAGDKTLRLRPPDEPLPAALGQAAATVAADLGLDPEWLNAVAALQWRTGLPPNLESRVHWTDYGGLQVGLADRYDLIFLKLYAAVDGGPGDVHVQDLLALTPSDEELDAAAAWVREQDPTPAIADFLTQVIRHVRSNRA